MGKRAARLASESDEEEESGREEFEGLSWKRTFFLESACLVVEGRFCCACVKSAWREASLGVVRVCAEVEVQDSPRNCLERSAYWLRSWVMESVSEERVARDSMPSRKDSRERAICAVVDGLGSIERDRARCRSRRESLMWSARRKSWGGFDIVTRVYVCPWIYIC